MVSSPATMDRRPKKSTTTAATTTTNNGSLNSVRILISVLNCQNIPYPPPPPLHSATGFGSLRLCIHSHTKTIIQSYTHLYFSGLYFIGLYLVIIAATCFGLIVGPSSDWSLNRWSVHLIMFSKLEIWWRLKELSIVYSTYSKISLKMVLQLGRNM